LRLEASWRGNDSRQNGLFIVNYSAKRREKKGNAYTTRVAQVKQPMLGLADLEKDENASAFELGLTGPTLHDDPLDGKSIGGTASRRYASGKQIIVENKGDRDIGLVLLHQPTVCDTRGPT
jgi:hypothetical protein